MFNKLTFFNKYFVAYKVSITPILTNYYITRIFFARKEGLAASSIILCFAIQDVLKDNDYAVYEGIAF